MFRTSSLLTRPRASLINLRSLPFGKLTMLAFDTSYVKSLLEHPHSDNPSAVAIISNLNLNAHPEGGFFAETDRNAKFMVPKGSRRYASTSIHYLLSLSSQPAPSTAINHAPFTLCTSGGAAT